MRPFIVAGCLALVLAGCGKQATGNIAAVDDNLATADVVTNDATAIDAAMGADANMAADIDLNAIDLNADGNAPAPGRRVSAGNQSGSSRPAAETNTVQASDSNSTSEEVETNSN